MRIMSPVLGHYDVLTIAMLFPYLVFKSRSIQDMYYVHMNHYLPGHLLSL